MQIANKIKPYQYLKAFPCPSSPPKPHNDSSSDIESHTKNAKQRYTIVQYVYHTVANIKLQSRHYLD